MRFSSEAFTNAFIFLTWALLIYSIFHDALGNTWWRVFIWSFSLIMFVLIYFGMSYLSHWTNFMISLGLIAGIFGEIIFELYYNFTLYDKILHFIIPFMTVIIFYDILKLRIPDKKKRIFWSIIFAISLSFLWEILEIIFDYFFDAPMVGVFVREPGPGVDLESIEIMSPLKDTIYDVILDFLGILSSAFLVRRNNSKSK